VTESQFTSKVSSTLGNRSRNHTVLHKALVESFGKSLNLRRINTAWCFAALLFTSSPGQTDMMQYFVAKNNARIKQKLDLLHAPKVMMASFVAHDELTIYYMSLVALIINWTQIRTNSYKKPITLHVVSCINNYLASA